MFKDTKEGQTNYCTHKNTNKSGICDKCLGETKKRFKEVKEHKRLIVNDVKVK